MWAVGVALVSVVSVSGKKNPFDSSLEDSVCSSTWYCLLNNGLRVVPHSKGILGWERVFQRREVEPSQVDKLRRPGFSFHLFHEQTFIS